MDHMPVVQSRVYGRNFPTTQIQMKTEPSPTVLSHPARGAGQNHREWQSPGTAQLLRCAAIRRCDAIQLLAPTLADRCAFAPPPVRTTPAPGHMHRRCLGSLPGAPAHCLLPLQAHLPVFSTGAVLPGAHWAPAVATVFPVDFAHTALPGCATDQDQFFHLFRVTRSRQQGQPCTP